MSTGSDRHLLFELFINNTQVELGEFFQEFTFAQGEDPKLAVVLHDHAWVRLCRLVTALRRADTNKVSFRFGWGGNEGDRASHQISPKYSTTYMDSEASFDHTGMSATILFAPTISVAFPEKTWEADGSTSPTDIVREIVNTTSYAQGFVTEPSKPITKKITLQPADCNDILLWIRKQFCALTDDFPPKKNSPRSLATSLNPERGGPFELWTGLDESGNFRLHFHSSNYPEQPAIKKSGRVYHYMHGNPGNVISFKIDDSKVIAAIFGGGVGDPTSTTGVSSDDKNIKTQPLDLKKKVIRAVDLSGEEIELSTLDGKTLPDAAIPRGTASIPLYFADSQEDAENAVKAAWRTAMVLNGYKASLEIIGDPTVQLKEIITVTVLMPDGTPFPLGGQFQVITIEHTINSEGFRTTLGLVKQLPSYGEGDDGADSAAFSGAGIPSGAGGRGPQIKGEDIGRFAGSGAGGGGGGNGGGSGGGGNGSGGGDGGGGSGSGGGSGNNLSSMGGASSSSSSSSMSSPSGVSSAAMTPGQGRLSRDQSRAVAEVLNSSRRIATRTLITDIRVLFQSFGRLFPYSEQDAFARNMSTALRRLAAEVAQGDLREEAAHDASSDLAEALLGGVYLDDLEAAILDAVEASHNDTMQSLAELLAGDDPLTYEQYRLLSIYIPQALASDDLDEGLRPVFTLFPTASDAAREASSRVARQTIRGALRGLASRFLADAPETLSRMLEEADEAQSFLFIDALLRPAIRDAHQTLLQSRLRGHVDAFYRKLIEIAGGG